MIRKMKHSLMLKTPSNFSKNSLAKTKLDGIKTNLDGMRKEQSSRKG